jgi:hypothetical protein
MNGGGGTFYIILDIVGPLLLIGAIAWAIWRNKKSRVPKEVTERGARQVYREERERRLSGTDDEER